MSKNVGNDIRNGSSYGPCFLEGGLYFNTSLNSENKGCCYTHANVNDHLKDSDGT